MKALTLLALLLATSAQAAISIATHVSAPHVSAPHVSAPAAHVAVPSPVVKAAPPAPPPAVKTVPVVKPLPEPVKPMVATSIATKNETPPAVKNRSHTHTDKCKRKDLSAEEAQRCQEQSK